MPREIDDIPDATLRLLTAEGVGPASVRKLRAAFDDDAAIVAASVAALVRVRGIGAASAGALRRAFDAVNVEAERRTLARIGARLVERGDDDYPALLAPTPGAPQCLWVRGAMDALTRRPIAIVGSRGCTAYGRVQAERFAARFAGAGCSIVSGGAIGIDAAAHRGALRGGGPTVAVLGSGLARIYPAIHRHLFDEIVAEGGAVVSEMAPRAGPRPGNFPRRNRIISGLAHAVVVVEARMRSGALITARLAVEEHGRDVFVLPGRLTDECAHGGLDLVRRGGAGLVLEPEDVLETIPDAPGVARPDRRAPAPVGGLLGAVLDASDDALALDEIVERSGLPAAEVMVEVTRLELAGRVRREGGGIRRVE